MKKILSKFSDYYIIFCIYALIGWIYEVLWMWFVVPPYHFINRGVLFGPFLPIYGFGMLVLLISLKKLMSRKHKLLDLPYLFITSTVITTFIYTTIIEYTTPKIYNVLEYLSKYGLGLIIINIIVLIILYILVFKKKIKWLRNINSNIILVFLGIWIIATFIEYVSHFVMDKYFHTILWDYTYDFLNINKRVNWDASRNFAIGGTFLLYVVQPLINKLLKFLKNNQKIFITVIIGIPMIIDFILRVVIK